ncbi:MAG: hypothetical protein KDE27_05575 [Planctomycetes bacterium]|nr:hypothetical protein [Planctomycetota bacterium]
MSPDLHLARRSFPARVADLGFAVELPADWIVHEIEAVDTDFSDPTAMAALAAVVAPHAAIVFAAAARPGFDDGTLDDWAGYLLRENGLAVRASGRAVVAEVSAVVGEATQDSEVGELLVRFAFFEDGGRLVNLALTAPIVLADAVRDAWFAVLRTFRLAAPRGAGPASAAPAAPSSPTEASAPVGFAAFALAVDAATLAPEDPTNANLRARGVGLVPNVLATDDGGRRATVAAGAIVARFDVPYGWHVIDDGRRVLVFEPSGRMQIHLDRLARAGRDDDRILDAIEREMRREWPAAEFVRVESGGLRALGARNLRDGSQPLEQYHILRAVDPTAALRARVTATPETATDACNLAELVLGSCDFGAVAPPEPAADADAEPRGADGPPWWGEALALEAADRCDAAEEHIRTSLPHSGSTESIAELYRLRMRRLLATGDRVGAIAAFRRAADAMRYFASLATSGGEGMARSLERDEFRARLVAEFGGDPDAAGA